MVLKCSASLGSEPGGPLSALGRRPSGVTSDGSIAPALPELFVDKNKRSKDKTQCITQNKGLLRALTLTYLHGTVGPPILLVADIAELVDAFGGGIALFALFSHHGVNEVGNAFHLGGALMGLRT